LFSKAELSWLGLFYLQSPGLGEGRETAVVGFFNIVRKTASGQLLYSQMRLYTFAAYSLFATWICTIAIFKILLFVAFHSETSSFQIQKLVK